MKQIIKAFVLQVLFWIIVFATGRTVFLLYHAAFIHEQAISLAEVLRTYISALKLDLATASYFMFIPLFLLFLKALFPYKAFDRITRVYTAIMLFLYSLVITGECGVYMEWKTKLHYKALQYLMHPSEIYNTSSASQFFVLIVILLLMFLLLYWLFSRYFYHPPQEPIRPGYKAFLLLFFLSACLFTGARGGFKPIPVNQSSAFFSRHNILNAASTNSAFNLYISIFENLRNLGSNPFVFYPEEEACSLIEKIYTPPKDTSIPFLTNPRPNIVVLLLESWCGDLIETIGGDGRFTPEFKKLEQEGLFFKGIYASGTRSEQGLGCLLSGFPAHPVSSVTVQPDKYNGLPSLVHTLNQQGYHSSFYFGGQLNYGNIKSYIYYNRFKRITELDDFDASLPRGRLGIHDEYTMQVQLDELAEQKEPFFSVLFTLSTHAPFDMPVDSMIDYGYKDEVNKYLNSARYTDACLGEYFRKARQQDWYANTLFILIADHSHFSQKGWDYYAPPYHKIPLLFYGEVIDTHFRGLARSVMGSQVDLPATLLSQMDIDNSEFHWSRDLMIPGIPQFAYVAFEEGIGWFRPGNYFFYDKRFDHYYCKHLEEDKEEAYIREGKSFLQCVFEEYLEM